MLRPSFSISRHPFLKLTLFIALLAQLFVVLGWAGPHLAGCSETLRSAFRMNQWLFVIAALIVTPLELKRDGAYLGNGFRDCVLKYAVLAISMSTAAWVISLGCADVPPEIAPIVSSSPS